MPDRSNRRRRDFNQLAHHVMLESTALVQPIQPEQSTKNPAAVALGRLGGLRGGAARAAKLSPRKRSQIAAKAAKARWSKRP